jgi:hypothetical protein
MRLSDLLGNKSSVLSQSQQKVEEELQRQVTERIKKAKASDKAGAFEKFGKLYFDSPAKFARDCILWPDGEALTFYQEEILESIPELERVAIRGPHGLGKSMMCSTSILWFALTREALRLDWKLPVTASVGNQLKNYLWPEVKKWSRRLDWNKIGRPAFNQRNELLTLELHQVFGQAFCVAPEEPGKIEGAHADHLYFCYDEAKLIPDGIWDAAEGAFSGAGKDTGRYAFALAISTPGEPTGRFHAIHQRAKGLKAWTPRHVTVDEAIQAGRISRQWVEEKKLQWGEKSALYQQKVLGNFASSDQDSIIPMDWVEAAANRYEERTIQADV